MIYRCQGGAVESTVIHGVIPTTTIATTTKAHPTCPTTPGRQYRTDKKLDVPGEELYIKCAPLVPEGKTCISIHYMEAGCRMTGQSNQAQLKLVRYEFAIRDPPHCSRTLFVDERFM